MISRVPLACADEPELECRIMMYMWSSVALPATTHDKANANASSHSPPTPGQADAASQFFYGTVFARKSGGR